LEYDPASGVYRPAQRDWSSAAGKLRRPAVGRSRRRVPLSRQNWRQLALHVGLLTS